MKEAPDKQITIPVIESTHPPAPNAFRKNTVESLEKDARATALANELATYGRGKYDAAREKGRTSVRLRSGSFTGKRNKPTATNAQPI